MTASLVDLTTDLFGGRWVDRARCLARRVAETRGEVSADDLREWAEETGDMPPHPNAWGAVFQGDAWEIASSRRSRWASCRGRRIAVWRLKGRTK